jgi:hypothetical protein
MNLRFIPLVILFLVSCSDTSKQDYQNYLNSRPRGVSGEFLEDYIDKYLAEKVTLPKNGNKAFCSHEILMSKNKQEKADFDIYFWVLCEEYNKEKKLVATTERPVSINFLKVDEQFKALSHQVPRNGAFYQKDVESIFPSAVRNDKKNVKIFSRKDPYYNYVKKSLTDRVKEAVKKA